MAAAPITCPSCAKKFKTKADVRGKRIRCPFCNDSFIVAIEDAADADDAVPAKAKQKVSADAPIPLAADGPGDAEEDEGDNPYVVTEIDLAPRCPNCAHEMPSDEAVICLNCGYNTLTREWGKTEKLLGVSVSRHTMHLLPGVLVLFLLVLCIIERVFYSVVEPYLVAGQGWMEYTDHESLRMWGTMIALLIIFPLGRFCYKRFIVNPMPDEIKVEG